MSTGLVILPGYLSHTQQRDLISWSLRDHARYPNETNLDTHYDLPKEGLWHCHSDDPSRLIQPRAICPDGAISETPGPRQLIANAAADVATFSSLSQAVKAPAAPSLTTKPATATELLPKLRWANIGWSYHWGTKQYDFAKGKGEVAGIIKTICQDVVKALNWKEVFGDTGTWPLRPSLESEDSTSEGDHDVDWDTWDRAYGQHAVLNFDHDCIIEMSAVEPDAGIVNFYQLKVCLHL